MRLSHPRLVSELVGRRGFRREGLAAPREGAQLLLAQAVGRAAEVQLEQREPRLWGGTKGQCRLRGGSGRFREASMQRHERVLAGSGAWRAAAARVSADVSRTCHGGDIAVVVTCHGEGRGVCDGRVKHGEAARVQERDEGRAAPPRRAEGHTPAARTAAARPGLAPGRGDLREVSRGSPRFAEVRRG